MPEKIKEETKKIDRFNIWIYIGFAILVLLLLLLIIVLILSFVNTNSSTSNTYVESTIPVIRNNSYLKSSPPIINNYKSSSNPIVSNFKTSPISNDRSKYMSSLFRYGGFRNRLKRY